MPRLRSRPAAAPGGRHAAPPAFISSASTTPSSTGARSRGGRRRVLVQLDARQRQQVLDQARHALGLLLHDRRKRSLRLGVVARRPPQGLDEADQAGQRRLQLVAGVGDEIGAQLLGALQRVMSISARIATVSSAVGRASGSTWAMKMRSTGTGKENSTMRPRPAGKGRGHRFDHRGIAQDVEQLAAGEAGPAAPRRRVGAHDPPLLVEHDQRVGQSGNHRLVRRDQRLQVAPPLGPGAAGARHRLGQLPRRLQRRVRQPRRYIAGIVAFGRQPLQIQGDLAQAAQMGTDQEAEGGRHREYRGPGRHPGNPAQDGERRQRRRRRRRQDGQHGPEIPREQGFGIHVRQLNRLFRPGSGQMREDTLSPPAAADIARAINAMLRFGCLGVMNGRR